MNPPAEQLIRDYLNRVSVAARDRLSAEDRRAFLARTREFIEQNTRALGHTDSTHVLKLLSGLGDPAVLVDRERDRLAGQRTGLKAGDSAGDAVSDPRSSARTRRWRPAKGSLTDLMAARAAPVPPGEALPVPEPAPDVPLTGEIAFQSRPITSRWRPGAPMVPKPPRQRRAGIPRRLQPDGPPQQGSSEGLPSEGLPSEGLPPGEAREDRAAGLPPEGVPPDGLPPDQQPAAPPPGAPPPGAPRPRFRRPAWPVGAPRRPDASEAGQLDGLPPAGGADARVNGQARVNGAQRGGARPDGPRPGGAQRNGAEPKGTEPKGTEPKGTEPKGTEPKGTGPDGARPGGAANGVQPDGTMPDGTMPTRSQPAAVPAQRAPADDAPPGGGPPAGSRPPGQPPGGTQPPATAPGASSASPPEADGVSSSDLVAGRAPGARRLAAVARGSGWASGVRARGARVAGARRVGRGPGAGLRPRQASEAGGGEPDSQPVGPSAEEPLSGLWPDLGPMRAGAVRLARTVLARARRRPLEATAIVLLGLGGLIYPPVWLVGAVVALVSKVWDIRDKWIGLAVPVFLVIVGMVADVSLGGTRSGLGGYAREAWIFGGHLSRVVAVLGAVYLAWRAERGRRSPPVAPWNKPRRLG